MIINDNNVHTNVKYSLNKTHYDQFTSHYGKHVKKKVTKKKPAIESEGHK